MKSIADHQAAFYASQSVDYRKGWWEWALEQPNFMDLVHSCDEKDASVLPYRERAIAKHKSTGGK
jgi:hypothetical protein